MPQVWNLKERPAKSRALCFPAHDDAKRLIKYMVVKDEVVLERRTGRRPTERGRCGALVRIRKSGMALRH